MESIKSDASKKSTAKKTVKKTAAKTAAKSSVKSGADLIIVESPTKAKKISKFFKGKYTVIASNGHVRDLPKSNIGIDPENGFAPKYITVRGRGELLDKIRKSAKTAKHVYLATDPDREGEAISWHLAAILGLDDASKCRIEFNEITETAVKAAIKNPRAINMSLVDAQQARRVLDRLVGYKISPILWHKVKWGLSAGRVQSVATRMICDREDEIAAFVPEEYWTVTALLDSLNSKKPIQAKYYGKNNKKQDIKTQQEADEIVSIARRGKFSITDIKTTRKSKHAPAPFTTSIMQQEASRKLGFTSEVTMKVAQDLYEGASFDAGLITYMRTDSVRVSTEAQTAALELIRSKYGENYAPQKPNFYKGKSNAQDAHEAIRPTNLKNTPQLIKDKLTAQQYKLYKLIYERFVASQMSDAQIDSTTVVYDVDSLTFRTAGQRTVFDGFLAVYNDNADETRDVALPALEVGEVLTPTEVKGEQHFTQPPARYNDATLVKAMDDLGIGRPSTYAPTISTIIARNYIKREKRILYPTELGMIVTDIMKANFSDIVSYEFTADMEEKLDHVAEGEIAWNKLVGEFYEPFEKTLKVAEASIEKVKLEDEVSDVPCDKCGEMMVYKMGRFGKFLACPNYPECKNTKPIVVKIDTPCPKCGAALIKRTTKGKGKTFFGCEKYPECDFTSWDMPLIEKCSVCGAYMVQKVFGRSRFKLCSNKDCASHKKRNESKGETEKNAD